MAIRLLDFETTPNDHAIVQAELDTAADCLESFWLNYYFGMSVREHHEAYNSKHLAVAALCAAQRLATVSRRQVVLNIAEGQEILPSTLGRDSTRGIEGVWRADKDLLPVGNYQLSEIRQIDTEDKGNKLYVGSSDGYFSLKGLHRAIEEGATLGTVESDILAPMLLGGIIGYSHADWQNANRA